MPSIYSQLCEFYKVYFGSKVEGTRDDNFPMGPYPQGKENFIYSAKFAMHVIIPMKRENASDPPLRWDALVIFTTRLD
ncbi:hypothetical protein Q3G72_035343 [Acer saccharum]|nr:hypothetical protein Q3G72_035343 [Acer saccharum]